MRRIHWLLALSCIVLAAGDRASAGPVFDFSTTVNASLVAVPNPPGFASVSVPITPAGSIQFTTNSGVNQNAGLPGGVDINPGNILFLPAGAPGGTINPYLVYFNYALTITETVSSQSATLNLTGTITGAAQSNGTINGINSVLTILGFATNPTVTLGDHVFTLSVKNATGPGASNPGTFQINVQAAAVPEPTSMALLGLAGVAGIAGLRRVRTASR